MSRPPCLTQPSKTPAKSAPADKHAKTPRPPQPLPVTTRRTPAAVPETSEKTARHVDVGDPLGDVLVHCAHALTGTRVSVPNHVWEPGRRGATTCDILGYARDTPWGSELGFYVLSDSQSGLAYPFAAATLRSLISPRLRKYV